MFIYNFKFVIYIEIEVVFNFYSSSIQILFVVGVMDSEEVRKIETVVSESNVGDGIEAEKSKKAHLCQQDFEVCI